MENPHTFQIFWSVSADVFPSIGVGSYRKMYNKSFVANGAVSAVCNRKRLELVKAEFHDPFCRAPLAKTYRKKYNIGRCVKKT